MEAVTVMCWGSEDGQQCVGKVMGSLKYFKMPLV